MALAVSGVLRHGVDTRAPFVSRDHTERTSLRTLYTHLTMNHLYVSVFLFSVSPKEIVRNLEKHLSTYLSTTQVDGEKHPLPSFNKRI